MKFQKAKSVMLRAVLLVTAIISTHFLQSQVWFENLPQSKVQNGTLTLHDYQKAFNNYWEPYQVENGYYVKNGEKVKAPYWKQFRRWEWYWETRVDPQTGAFPTKSAADEYQKYLLENGGGLRSPSGNWTSMGPSSSNGGYAGIGRLNCVAFRPGDNNTIYAGAASGGIWKTTNGGTTWTPLGDQNAVLGVSDIIVISGTPDILYIATGDKDGGSLWSLGGQQSNDNNSVGVLKSTDGGATWNTTGLSWSASQKNLVSRLILDPNSGNQTIYAATSIGIYKTTNAGASWTQQQPGNFIDMEINPSNSSILYASTIDYWGSPRIYYTTNGGTNWNVSKTFATSEYRVDIAVTAANSAYVYAIVSDRNTISNNNGGLSSIERSTNSGVSFSSVYTYNGSNTNMLNWDCSSSSGGGQGAYDLCIIADPSNANTVYIGGVNTWKSTNGGSSWSINTHWSGTCSGSATTVHADQHFMAYQPGTSNLFLCNDGGLYKTTNGGNSWTDLTNTMVISQIYRLGVGQSSSSEVITGLQDNGTKVYSTGSWTDEIGGDGMECIVDYTTNNTQYGTIYFGDIFRTTNHWATYQQKDPGVSGAWVTPYVIDPNSNQTLIAGYSDVYKTTNRGDNWTTISSGLTGGTDLRSIAIAPSNSNYIYVATLSNIWRTTVGGGAGNWTNITGTLPVGSSQITYISVKDTDPNTVWVSFGGYNTHGVYQTTNGGGSWTNISSGLPSLPTMCVIQNKQNVAQDELYAATDVGVYVKVGGANWVPFSTGLPNVVVTELEIYYDTNPANSRLRAATFGRGLWESDLYTGVTAPVADFSADDLTPIIGQTVTFTDLSTNTPTSWAWVFTPNTVTYVGGTNASSQHPQVQFNAAGSYDVSLTATNAGGSDIETKASYISVAVPAPVADFSANDQTPIIGQTVTFTDLSTNTPTSWAWVFTPNTVAYVGGTNASSQNPQVQFNAAGSYDVSLTATNAGGSDIETKASYISVAVPAPVADFSADDQTPIIGQTVTFTDLSTNTPTSWAWVFTPNTVAYVGGTNASSQHPQVQFNAAGSYDVSLTATNAGGSDTETKFNYINVSIPAPVADFSADNTTPETTETVNFTDLSTNSPTSWAWVFTPGTITYMNGTNAGSQHPKVRFDAEGLYDVQLTATNATGSDVELKTDYINCTNAPPPPDADFVADNLNPTIEETVNFTDLSTNTPTSWAWVFTPSTVTYLGGTNANSQHPQVRFDNTGLYTVQLTATNAVGSDIEIKTDYIDATEPAPVADFSADNLSPTTNETVNFTDLSTNNPTSWSWIFTPSTITYMNGTNSNSQHPEVRFDAVGAYTVELTATNAGGSDTEIKSDYITASDPLTPPVADFSADNLNPTIEETVNFTDLSTNVPASWAWSFSPSTITYMDGTNANSQNPKVRFDDPGAYTVELTAINAGGSDTEIKTDYINATVVPPVADFVADNTTPDIGETVIFTDLSTNTPTSWLWVFTPSTVTFVSGTDENSQHPDVQFDAGGLYTVELTATNAGGSDTETKTGYINAGDVFEVIATATPDEICEGRSVLLQSFPSGGSGNYTFLWTSDPSGFTSNDQNVLAYPVVTTTYTVEVDDGNQAVSADVVVTVHPLPNITLGNWPDILCHENEPPVQLTAIPTGGIYSGSGVTMTGLFDPEIAPLGWNVITYTYEDAFGCENSAQDSIFVDDCVGMRDPYSLNAHVILYPNPNDGKFTINSSHLIKRVEIINQMGKIILAEEYDTKEIHLNMILPKGLYFVRTFVSDNNKTARVNKGLMIQ